MCVIAYVIVVSGGVVALEGFHHVIMTEDAVVVVVVVEVKTCQTTSHLPSPMVCGTIFLHVTSSLVTLYLYSAVNRGCMG